MGQYTAKLNSHLSNCQLCFTFYLFIYKKVVFFCSIQKIFVILQRFCMVHTLHLTQKYTCSVDKWGVKVVLTVKRAIY